MSVPEAKLNELDGALGTLPAGAQALVIVGTADAGPVDTPAAFARTKDVKSNFTAGQLVEAAAYWIENYRRPAILVRTGDTTAGTHTDLDVTGVEGDSVVTIGAGDEPNDDYEPYFEVVKGGTIETEGITFKWSLDGGRTLSPETALGTANSFSFPGAGTTSYDFAAGDLNAGDVVTSRTTSPSFDSTELGTALDALKNSTHEWEQAWIVNPIDATTYDVLTTKFAGMPTKNWIATARPPNVGETEAAYKTAIDAIFDPKSTTAGMVCAGDAKVTSSVSYRSYRRPASFVIAPRQGSVAEHVDIAALNLGPLPGVSIKDANNNPDGHDERLNPGLDASRFAVLRSWEGRGGVYVNNPRLHSPAGSDFEFVQHRRVMNLAKRTLQSYFEFRLSVPILVNATTGFIRESEALDIESGADAILRAVLEATPKASGGGFSEGRYVSISRTDNLLSTKTITGQGRIVPLAYPKFIEFDIGFFNPALQVVAA